MRISFLTNANYTLYGSNTQFHRLNTCKEPLAFGHEMRYTFTHKINPARMAVYKRTYAPEEQVSIEQVSMIFIARRRRPSTYFGTFDNEGE